MAPGQPAPFLLTGSAPGDRFGDSVALAPGVGINGAAAVIVGAPGRDQSEEASDAGGAFIWRFDPGASAFEPAPWGLMGGEVERPGSLLGIVTTGGSVDGQPTACVAGYRSSMVGLDQGAVLCLPLVE